MVRGDVHTIVLPQRRGRVQRGSRYAVIVQADDLLSLSTIVVSPTSQSVASASFHPQVTVAGQPTKVLCEMTGAVDAHRLGGRVGHLTLGELAAVDEALALVLDLA